MKVHKRLAILAVIGAALTVAAACDAKTDKVNECDWEAHSIEYAVTVAGPARPAPTLKVPGAKPPVKMPTVKPPKPSSPPLGKVWVWDCG